MNFSDQDWYRSVISENLSNDISSDLKGSFVGDVEINPIIAKVYQDQRLSQVFSAPIKDADGNIMGVLCLLVNFKYVEKIFIDTYGHLVDEGLANTELTLLNKDGDVIIDYDPSKNSGSREVKHDFKKTLFKLNLARSGVESAVAAVSGKKGTNISLHIRKKIYQVSGYSPIESDDFLSTLGWSVLVRVDRDQAFSTVNESRNLFYLICISSLILMTIVSSYISKNISKKLSLISDGITEGASIVSGASNQLSSASTELSGSATEAASSLQETVASLEELTSMVKVNSDHASEASNIAQKSSAIADRGEQEVRALIDSITDLSTSSKKIEEIINVIDDIAFQTNLLALNAAVEAARAGEQGKGFAVVAEAVRNLAQRSATAAKEINTLIKENVVKIERGTKTADQSGTVLKEILSSVKKVAGLNNEISVASKEQSTGLAQISTAMNELDSATQNNAASSDQVASASLNLSHQSTNLQNFVSDLNLIIHGHKNSVPTNKEPKEDIKGKSKVIKFSHDKEKKDSSPKDKIPFEEQEKLDSAAGF